MVFTYGYEFFYIQVRGSRSASSNSLTLCKSCRIHPSLCEKFHCSLNGIGKNVFGGHCWHFPTKCLTRYVCIGFAFLKIHASNELYALNVCKEISALANNCHVSVFVSISICFSFSTTKRALAPERAWFHALFFRAQLRTHVFVNPVSRIDIE